MSNEELAEQIKDGQRNLIPELWENVKGFILYQSGRYYRYFHGLNGVEPDDLVQCGYLAMLQAVEYFNPEKAGFLTVLGFFLKKEFQDCYGIRTIKRDPLNTNPISLEAPLNANIGEGTWKDYLEDPRDDYETVEQRIWLEQLSKALDAALDRLPEDQKQTIIDRYYKEKTLEQIAEETGCSRKEIIKRERSGLKQLWNEKQITGIEQYVESHTLFYRTVSVNQFMATHSSAVEKTVLIREDLRQHYLQRILEEQYHDHG